MDIQITINGVNLEEPSCYNCGKEFAMLDGSLFVVYFDEGRMETKTDPGIEPVIFLECMECYNGVKEVRK